MWKPDQRTGFEQPPKNDKKLCSPFNPFPEQALVFMCVQHRCFENTVGKGEIARDEQFLFFPQCFLLVRITF